MSAYLSYRTGRELTRRYQQDPKAAREAINSPYYSRYFDKFGPAFPVTGRSVASRSRSIDLTEHFFIACCFAADYQAEVSRPNNIRLRNIKGGSAIALSDLTFHNFPGTQQAFLNITGSLFGSGQEARVPVPGAVLLIDGRALKQNNLLLDIAALKYEERFNGRHLAEETASASYLPWQLIRGILFLNEMKVTSFWFRDSRIQQDLNDHLLGIRGFKAEEMMPHENQLSRARIQWHIHL